MGVCALRFGRESARRGGGVSGSERAHQGQHAAQVAVDAAVSRRSACHVWGWVESMSNLCFYHLQSHLCISSHPQLHGQSLNLQ